MNLKKIETGTSEHIIYVYFEHVQKIQLNSFIKIRAFCCPKRQRSGLRTWAQLRGLDWEHGHSCGGLDWEHGHSCGVWTENMGSAAGCGGMTALLEAIVLSSNMKNCDRKKDLISTVLDWIGIFVKVNKNVFFPFRSSWVRNLLVSSYPGLWIRIHFLRPDPAAFSMRIRIQLKKL